MLYSCSCFVILSIRSSTADLYLAYNDEDDDDNNYYKHTNEYNAVCMHVVNHVND